MTTQIWLASGRRKVVHRLAATLFRPATRSSVSAILKYPTARRTMSSAAAPVAASSRYAVVDHSEAYENAMKGRHGQQLSLAQLEGIGKDDPPYDPFMDGELVVQELLDDVAEVEEFDEEEEEDFDEAEEEDVDEAEEADVDEEEELQNADDDETDNDEEAFERSLYRNDGSVRRKKSELAALQAGAPAGGLFAVVKLAGSQHKVTLDDVLIVNKVKPVDTFAVGSVHTLKDVLLVSSSQMTLVGMPVVEGAEVDVMVEEITQDAKVIIFKRRKGKNYRRKNGFRRDITMLRVLDIRMPEPYKDHKGLEQENTAGDQ